MVTLRTVSFEIFNIGGMCFAQQPVCIVMCAGVKEHRTMAYRLRGSDAPRKETVLTARRSWLWPHCPVMAQPPALWPCCVTSLAWSTPPMSPAWRTLANQAAPPAWQHAATPRRVSVSEHTNCVCFFMSIDFLSNI